MLGQVPHCNILPLGNFLSIRHGQSLATHRLPQSQCKPGHGIGHILAEDKHCICRFGLLDAGDMEGRVSGNLKSEFCHREVTVGATGIEVLHANKVPQGEVGLVTSPGRADADYFSLF